LVWANQGNYFENATTCSKRTLKTTVAMQLYSKATFTNLFRGFPQGLKKCFLFIFWSKNYNFVKVNLIQLTFSKAKFFNFVDMCQYIKLMLHLIFWRSKIFFASKKECLPFLFTKTVVMNLTFRQILIRIVKNVLICRPYISPYLCPH